MTTFAMLTRLSPAATPDPRGAEVLEKRVVDRVTADCPSVRWLQSYVVLGRYDYLDIFQAPDVETALKVATLVRSLGSAQTEVWPLVEWGRFKEILHERAH